MIPTKDKLDELAEIYRDTLLGNAEDSVTTQVIEAKACRYPSVVINISETISTWMLKEIGKRYEEEGYKVIYDTQSSFLHCGIEIILDDEKYEQEREERWISTHMIPCEKKWWEFWK